jgi:hypothetical protein
MSETMYCARHKDTETNLRCGRCEEPVCPRCLVHGPVGVRCPDCAQVRRPPTFDVTRVYLARAIAAGLTIAVVGGLAFSFLRLAVGWGPLLDWIGILGMGYAIGEGISIAVNRKRGRSLKIVAAGSVLLASSVISFVGLASFSIFGFLPGMLAVAGAFYVAINRFS